MAKVTVVLDVDEDVIKDVSGQETLDDAVQQELGWLHDSGMFVDSVRVHESIYLRLDENREWTSMVGVERPCEGAVLFVEEQEYPAKFYYSRTDLNGSASVEMDVCENRDEMIQSLNWMGKCGYTPLKVWEFDANKCEDRELWEIFDAGSARRAEAAREEMDGLMGLDDAIKEASLIASSGIRDQLRAKSPTMSGCALHAPAGAEGPGVREGIGELANSPMDKKGSDAAGRDEELDRYF